MSIKEVNYDAKAGDFIRFVNGKKIHRVVSVENNRVKLAEPTDGGGEGHWTASYAKLAEVKAFYVYEIYVGLESTMQSVAERGVRALNPKTLKYQTLSPDATYAVRRHKLLDDPDYGQRWTASLMSDQDLRQIAENRGLII